MIPLFRNGARCAAIGLLCIAGVMAAGCGTDVPPEPAPPVRAMLERGTKELQRFDFARALATADSVTRRAPWWSGGYRLRATALGEVGLLEDAEAAFEEALQRNPEDAEAWRLRGEVALRRGAPDRALDFFRRALTPQATSASWHNIGRAFAAGGKTDSARSAFEKAIRLNKDDVSVYRELAKLYEKHGNLQEAVTNARRAEVRNSNDLETRQLLGRLYTEQGRLDLAIPHLKAVADRRSGDFEANSDVGQALQLVGLDQYAAPYLQRADSLRAAGYALREARKAIEENPTDPEANAKLASSMRRQRRYGDAQRYYQIAHYFAPDSSEYANNAAAMMLLRGDAATAARRFQDVLAQDSTYVESWLNLGVSFVQLQQPARARWAWKQVLRIDPGNDRAREYLADLDDAEAQNPAATDY